MALTAKTIMIEKIYALKQIGNILGMYGNRRTVPILTEKEKLESLACIAIITDPQKSVIAKMACSLILDYYVPKWRDIVGNGVLGNIASRNGKEVRRWRKRVLDRDGHKCTECAATENLEAHHIAHWADFPELRLIDDNGKTLCNKCHAKQHTKLANLILSRTG